jgi:hypothetical protein
MFGSLEGKGIIPVSLQQCARHSPRTRAPQNEDEYARIQTLRLIPGVGGVIEEGTERRILSAIA